MKVELIPVIEITNYDQDIPTPGKGPYWEYADEWENYHISTNLSAGFTEHLKPYFKGSSFYRTSEIPDTDLLKVIHKEIALQQTEEENGIEDLISTFSGGYILRIDNADKYFPQCCGSLADINSWIDLLDESCDYFYIGHPSPRIQQTKSKIILDFLNAEIQDGFTPPINEDILEIERSTLKNAIEHLKKELDNFAEKLIRINKSENLNIPDIEKVLIYGILEG